MEDHATIALKGAHKGVGRSEFEYTIPNSDAEEILRTMCDDRVLEKVRNYVPYAGLTWEIDVYDGILKGVIKPSWTHVCRRQETCSLDRRPA
jgi:adenylate cyclase